jgi:Rieske Fe-S protein
VTRATGATSVDYGSHGIAISGLDAVDEMVELRGGQLHIRSDRSAWIDVGEAHTATAGRPIRFATAELVGYLTVDGEVIVAVVGVCSRCGCLLQAGGPSRWLWCPSAGAIYRPNGRVLDPGGHYRPPPLPLLPARLVGHRLQAMVPTEKDAP